MHPTLSQAQITTLHGPADPAAALQVVEEQLNRLAQPMLEQSPVPEAVPAPLETALVPAMQAPSEPVPVAAALDDSAKRAGAVAGHSDRPEQAHAEHLVSGPDR